MSTMRCSVIVNHVQKIDEIRIVYRELMNLQNEYPNFKKWFFEKVVPGVFSGERIIVTVSDGDDLLGVMILKNSSEKKICTLRVLPKFQRQGIGHLLLDYAISVLGTSNPVITVSDEHIQEFSSILLGDYNFSLTELQAGYYRKDHTEYVFNGSLIQQ